MNKHSVYEVEIVVQQYNLSHLIKQGIFCHVSATSMSPVVCYSRIGVEVIPNRV